MNKFEFRALELGRNNQTNDYMKNEYSKRFGHNPDKELISKSEENQG